MGIWDDELGRILETIRQVESSGSYTARSSTSSASGAYQFIDATWLGLGGGAYAPRAWQATPAEQDRIAGDYVRSILAKHRDDLTAVPRIWYVGSTSKPDSYRPPGNSLTVGEYVRRWSDTFEGLLIAPPIKDRASEAAGAAKDAIVGQITDALGELAEPFLTGLRRLSIIALAVTGGVVLVVAGAWRGVKGG